MCSVCEGALLLVRAGLSEGHAATTHWAFVKCLQRFPGLDESLKLIELLFGDEIAK